MLTILIGIITIVLVFGLAVFVHELGHFFFARIRGVGVEEFAIGMGPKIVSFPYKGTMYSLRWLPVGGYVKLHQMIREDAVEEEKEKAAEKAENPSSAVPAADPTDASVQGVQKLGLAAHQDMAALYQKDLFTKLLVFGGGVFFNFLTAIATLVLLYTIGFKEPIPVDMWVGEISQESSVYKAGLRPYDQFLEIEGKPAKNELELGTALMGAINSGAAQDGLDVKVARGGETMPLKLAALSAGEAGEAGQKEFMESLEWDFPAQIGGIVPFRPAARAGLKEDDIITKAEGKPIKYWSEMVKVVKAHPNKAIELVVWRPGKEEGTGKELTFTVVTKEDKKKPGTGLIGIAPGSGKYNHIQEPFLTALTRGPGRATDWLVMLAQANYYAIKGSTFASLREEVGGPIAIATLTYQQAQKGFRDVAMWFMKLNLILAIMNLLPIPVLDGGFIVLSLIEAVIRRPVSSKILTPVYTFFALCFMTLLVLISYQDILNTLF